MSRAGAIGAAILLQTTLGSPAMAQTLSPDAAVDRAEALADRGSEIGSERGRDIVFRRFTSKTGEAAEDKPKRWTLTGEVSFSYSDNAALAETGKVDAAHLTPNISLKREIPLSKSIMLSIQLRSDFDAFVEQTENDTTAWSVTSQVRFGDANKQIAPYVLLANNGIYAGQWGSHIITTHTIGIGASRNIALREGGSLGLDLNLVRREATILTVEANRAQFTVKYEGQISTKWSWSTSARLRYFDFSGGAAAAREDTQLRTALGVTHKFNDVIALSGNIVFARNWSNVAGKSYTNIDVGPTLSLGTKF
jgi:hypothetical protein